MDVEKELSKLQTKQDKLIIQMDKLRRDTQMPEYETKVGLAMHVHDSMVHLLVVYLGSRISKEE